MKRWIRAGGAATGLLVALACTERTDLAEKNVGVMGTAVPSSSNSAAAPPPSQIATATAPGSTSGGTVPPLASSGAPGLSSSPSSPSAFGSASGSPSASASAASTGAIPSAEASAGGLPSVPSGDGGEAGAGAVEAGTPDDLSIAQELNSSSGFKLEAPCGAINSTQRSCDHEPRDGCGSGLSTFLRTDETLGGDPGTFYNVTLRFRGILEANQYEGGTSDHNGFYTGGHVSNANGLDGGEQYNQYVLEVASPQAVYHLNNIDQDQRDTYREGLAGSSGVHHFGFIIDYRATIRMEGGTAVSLYMLDNDCLFGRNCVPPADNFGQCEAQTYPDLPGIQQPFDGNFIWIDVEDVVVAP